MHNDPGNDQQIALNWLAPSPLPTAMSTDTAPLPPSLGSPDPAATALWTRAMDGLRSRCSRAIVDAWYRPIKVLGSDRTHLYLGVPDRETHDVLARDHVDRITAVLQEIADRPIEVALCVTSPTNVDGPVRGAQAELPIAAKAIAPAPAWSDNLVQMLTFDAFVQGRSNQMAHGAARAVVQAPGTSFNPLFVHGGVGVGKTHLLNAIGIAVRRQHKGLRVLYVQAASFIDDVIAAMRSKQPSAMADVRARYRHVDVLLVDDIQFLRGKTRTEEEFFHTFNALHQAARQIVITSDRHPNELAGFQDRLSSRFSWGLVTEIGAPDRDMRVSVLLKKAREYDIAAPLDVLHYLADHLRNNVRELEGALKKLMAHSRIGGREIDLPMARDVLGPVLETPAARMTIDAIQRATAQHFGLRVTDLKGSKRHRAVVVPRMIAMHLCRTKAGASFPEIGRAFGGRDHSTAINANRRIVQRAKTESQIRADIDVIAASLGR